MLSTFLATTGWHIGNENMAAFIWKSRRQRIYLWMGVSAIFLLLFFFKRLYPRPNLVLDSYYYIKAALADLSINAWPIGYSKFLLLLNFFWHSAYAVVAFQYIFLELSLLLFFFSWQFLFQPGKLVTNFIFVLFFLNPLFLYCCNYILADALFISLSILWITQLWWIVCQPRPYMIFMHALLLILVFTVRYNALYYPVIAAFAFLLSRQDIWLKVAGILLPFILIICFIFHTSAHVAIVTGERQFSPFGGWKLANDALYGYAHVSQKEIGPVPPRFLALDSTVRDFFFQQKSPLNLLENDSAAGSFYMFQQSSPLVIYMESLYGGGPPFLNKKKWLAVAPLYQSYGAYLIKKYPVAFAQYFLGPNLVRYFFPPGEIFGSTDPFNIHEGFGGIYVRQLFNINSLAAKPAYIQLSVDVLAPYSMIFTIFHMTFILALLLFFIFRGFNGMEGSLVRCISLVTILWLFDLCFSVFSAGIVLRYQIFMMVIEMTFGIYLIECVYRKLDRVPATAINNI